MDRSHSYDSSADPYDSDDYCSTSETIKRLQSEIKALPTNQQQAAARALNEILGKQGIFAAEPTEQGEQDVSDAEQKPRPMSCT
jgi:hypothetical protein